MANQIKSGFSIWAVDNAIYWPVDLSLLTTWVQEERVTPTTWIYAHAASFQSLADIAPELATPFLMAMGRTLTSRIRADNKRFRDSLAVSRGVGGLSI
ncbi:MAG: hypothetical protein ACO1QB_03685 [Verrucomicrobiales bacterium]